MPEAFTNYCDAARALLDMRTLSEREGQFCGGLCFRRAPLSEKHDRWLRILLDRHGLPHFTQDADNG